MILWWIGDIVLLAVVLPLVVYLLRGVLDAANGVVPQVGQITAVAGAASKDLTAGPPLFMTEGHAKRTVAGLADYGGSLDVILDDSPEVQR